MAKYVNDFRYLLAMFCDVTKHKHMYLCRETVIYYFYYNKINKLVILLCEEIKTYNESQTNVNI